VLGAGEDRDVHAPGDVCTRHCGFCAVGNGKPGAVEPGEPDRGADAVAELGLAHAVVTSVNRDDLPDGGASHFAETIGAIRRRSPGCAVEVLIPDFCGDARALATVLEAAPTSSTTTSKPFPASTTASVPTRSTPARSPSRKPTPSGGAGSAMRTKSGIMAGLGENFEEIVSTLADLRAHGCDIATIGQYLQPYDKRLPSRSTTHRKNSTPCGKGRRLASSTSSPARSCALRTTPGTPRRPDPVSA
jgi:lipoic acid synthetase